MITPEQQKLVIERLYRSNDSITSTKNFNSKYGKDIGPMGINTMTINDFGRKMQKTDFSSFEVEKAVQDITGQEVDLESL